MRHISIKNDRNMEVFESTISQDNVALLQDLLDMFKKSNGGIVKSGHGNIWRVPCRLELQAMGKFTIEITE